MYVIISFITTISVHHNEVGYINNIHMYTAYKISNQKIWTQNQLPIK